MPNDYYNSVAHYDGGCPACGIIWGVLLTVACALIWMSLK